MRSYRKNIRKGRDAASVIPSLVPGYIQTIPEVQTHKQYPENSRCSNLQLSKEGQSKRARNTTDRASHGYICKRHHEGGWSEGEGRGASRNSKPMIIRAGAGRSDGFRNTNKGRSMSFARRCNRVRDFKMAGWDSKHQCGVIPPLLRAMPEGLGPTQLHTHL